MEESKLNLLAMDKSVLSLLKGPDNWDIVSLDLKSIEPKVIAHFSQCPNYMKLFGPGANPNHDVYIFVGMAIPEYRGLFEPYYDIDNPTKEGIAHIKEHYNTERQVCKQFHLAAVYGAGANRINAMLESSDIYLGIRKVEQMHRNYWNLFKVVKQYTRQLQHEWNRNGGYIISGRGTPRPLTRQRAQVDILNAMIQTTAHQYLMRWLTHVKDIRAERQITTRPLLLDLHDSTTWVCPKEETQRVDTMLQDGLKRLNEELQLTVILEGKTKIGSTLELIA